MSVYLFLVCCAQPNMAMSDILRTTQVRPSPHLRKTSRSIPSGSMSHAHNDRSRSAQTAMAAPPHEALLVPNQPRLKDGLVVSAHNPSQVRIVTTRVRVGTGIRIVKNLCEPRGSTESAKDSFGWANKMQETDSSVNRAPQAVQNQGKYRGDHPHRLRRRNGAVAFACAS